MVVVDEHKFYLRLTEHTLCPPFEVGDWALCDQSIAPADGCLVLAEIGRPTVCTYEAARQLNAPIIGVVVAQMRDVYRSQGE